MFSLKVLAVSLLHHFRQNIIPLAGIEDSITSSAPIVTQDFHHALSLLSTKSRGSDEPKPISAELPNKAAATLPVTLATSQRLPPEDWYIGQQPVNSSMWISYSN
ncbi:unnamed protein product [Lupinus luteus]|uniref:Uncharacterized protein n=1 Tax=Lupinus luteus TaxID=3873 RepID=A0AAV1Y9E3_LUPLU